MTEPAKEYFRRVRSFVRRDGRVNVGQQNAIDKHWSRFGLEKQSSPLSLCALFEREAPTILEIGFGNGDTFIQMAQAQADTNFLGAEVYRPGIGSVLGKTVALELSNVRVYNDDAIELLNDQIADASLAGVHLYFPDPWHKKKHNKRRIVNTEFLQLISRKLVPGGRFHFATDWQPYAEWALEYLQACDTLVNTQNSDTPYSARPDWRPVTKFERRGQRLGHGVWDLIFTRV